MFNENTMLLMLYVAQLLHISFMTINIKERIEIKRNGPFQYILKRVG